MTIELNDTQLQALTAVYNDGEQANGYQSLKAKLSKANYTKLRAQCNTDSYIKDNDLIWAIINVIDDGDIGIAGI